jgi:hypothetical protein
MLGTGSGRIIALHDNNVRYHVVCYQYQTCSKHLAAPAISTQSGYTQLSVPEGKAFQPQSQPYPDAMQSRLILKLPAVDPE